MHLARHSPTEGGDSEVSGDGSRGGMARSLSTSASDGRDMVLKTINYGSSNVIITLSNLK
nr:hypothetical protein [Tanacetum cinerariifolium]